jgi:hypothetical protein
MEFEMSETVQYRTAIGYEYPVFDVVVTEVEQRCLHGHCGIAETVYGDYVDPTFVARDPILLNTQTVLANHPDRTAPPDPFRRGIEDARPCLGDWRPPQRLDFDDDLGISGPGG